MYPKNGNTLLIWCLVAQDISTVCSEFGGSCKRMYVHIGNLRQNCMVVVCVRANDDSSCA